MTLVLGLLVIPPVVATLIYLWEVAKLRYAREELTARQEWRHKTIRKIFGGIGAVICWYFSLFIITYWDVFEEISRKVHPQEPSWHLPAFFLATLLIFSLLSITWGWKRRWFWKKWLQ